MGSRSKMTDVGYDIVMLALPRWDGLYSSTAYSLAKELSRHTRVFYIDNPFTWKDFFINSGKPSIARRRKALLWGNNPFTRPDPAYPQLVAATPRLVFPINWMPPGRLYDAFAQWNDSIVYKIIDAILIEFNVRKFVFINSFNPLFARFFPPDFRPALTIYHCVDDISRSEYISRHGTYLEKKAVMKADITLVTSKELQRLKSAESPNVIYHPNAADVNLFQIALGEGISRPTELREIPEGKKIIFYMGNICHRIDYELLVKIAAVPHYHLVMVGPRTNDNYKNAGLDKLSNVTFTGRKELVDLPSYVKFADCCIIPFLCTALTKSIYPLKINEYLSAGKPVVTTNFSEDIANFAQVAHVCNSHEDFLRNIALAVDEHTTAMKEERKEYAAANNWKSRALDLLDIIKRKLH
jgi:teichuronic acid biosynthesis glycosyltransferase TuaH